MRDKTETKLIRWFFMWKPTRIELTCDKLIAIN